MCKLFKLYDLTLKNLSVIAEEPLSVGTDAIGIVLMRSISKQKAKAATAQLRFPAGVERKFSVTDLPKAMVETSFFKI